MASSDPSPEPEALRALGRALTGTEAKALADRLGSGYTLTLALASLSPAKQTEIKDVLVTAVGGAHRTDLMTMALRAIEGARSRHSTITPVWTMPGHLAQAGGLTSSVSDFLGKAKSSITCSTFNFQRSSALWVALKQAVDRPSMQVRVYLDRDAAVNSFANTANPEEVALHLKPARVFKTKDFDGKYVRNHAKAIVVDHRFVFVTSANFSWSAENHNVEFGVRIDDAGLSQSIEGQLSKAETIIYDRAKAAHTDG